MEVTAVLYGNEEYRYRMENHVIEKEALIEKLRVDGSEIRKQGDEGVKLAQDIMRYYTMWHDCPGDNCAYVLVEGAYEKWKEMQK
jgi:hypothetical protein